MFCKNCGKPISEKDKFCVYCGTPVSAPEPAPEPVIPMSRRYEKNTAAIVTVVLVVGIFIIGSLFFAVIEKGIAATNTNDTIISPFEKDEDEDSGDDTDEDNSWDFYTDDDEGMGDYF